MSDYAAMSDAQLLALEEYLYDEELGGVDTWFERDQVLWEMNRRGFPRVVLKVATGSAPLTTIGFVGIDRGTSAGDTQPIDPARGGVNS